MMAFFPRLLTAVALDPASGLHKDSLPACDPRSAGSEYRAPNILLRKSDRPSSSRVSSFVLAAAWHRKQAALAIGILGSGKAELRLSRQETRSHRPHSDYGNWAGKVVPTI